MRPLTVAYFASACLLAAHDNCVVQALARPARSSRPNAKKGRGTAPAGGFAPRRQRPRAPEAPTATAAPAAADASGTVATRAVRNLFSACAHIQDPRLYRPRWADACELRRDPGGAGTAVVATRDVAAGHPLTLFPIHALGLRAMKTAKNPREDTEFLAYDRDVDGELFDEDAQQGGTRLRLDIPLDPSQPASSVLSTGQHHALFSECLSAKDAVPGWLGGRARSAAPGEEAAANCVAVPLPGAAPLCAVVATRDVAAGEEAVRAAGPPEPRVLEGLGRALAEAHGRDLALLGTHVVMACEAAGAEEAARRREAARREAPRRELGPFHEINARYPGLRRIHEEPTIYAVDDFLTDDECDRIIAKAAVNLQPCLVNNESSGRAEQDPARTSTNANVPQREMPAVVRKVTALANCRPEQLEIFQVLNYRAGQEFVPHTDGFEGPYSACGFVRSARLATVFVYLNDVPEGGATAFPRLGLDVRPRRGTAVVHFPADVGMREDVRTLHAGAPAVHEKWLLTTWVWQADREEGEYDEGKLPSLSGDIIRR